MSSDSSLGIISQGVLLFRLEQAHEEKAINCVIPVSENLVATGDDDGTVHIWDLRAHSTKRHKVLALSFEDHEGTVNGLCPVLEEQKLLSCANDGALGVFDLRKSGELYAMSDCLEEDLSAVCVLKGAKKKVCVSS